MIAVVRGACASSVERVRLWQILGVSADDPLERGDAIGGIQEHLHDLV